jgi:toxin YoeB
MKTYTLHFRLQAIKDIKDLKKSDKNAFKKLEKLLEELRMHPYSGSGKPEQLKYVNKNEWSRRISQKHRLVYTVNDQEVIVSVLSAMGHYEDK